MAVTGLDVRRCDGLRTLEERLLVREGDQMVQDGRERAWDVIKRGTDLSKAGDIQSALEVLDSFLSEAIRENCDSIKLVTGTAAVMAEAMGDLRRVRRYDEQSLAYFPDDPQTLYGLARVLSRDGEAELGKQYAVRSYEVSMGRGTEVDLGLVELIVKQWPEVDQRNG